MDNARVGFELEIGVPNSRKSFIKDLRKCLTPTQQSYLKFHHDYSIDPFDTDDELEIVTDHLPEKSAMKLLSNLMGMCKLLGAETNISTGLHVNVSTPSIKRINPFALLMRLNENRYLKKWDRYDNMYSKPWGDTYFSKLFTNKQGWVFTDYDQWKASCECFVQAVCGKYTTKLYEKLPSHVMKYARQYEIKRISVSIPYAWSRGYLEYRIIGGNYLNRKKSVFEDTQHFIDVTKTSHKYDVEELEQYLKRLYTKYTEDRRGYA